MALSFITESIMTNWDLKFILITIQIVKIIKYLLFCKHFLQEFKVS